MPFKKGQSGNPKGSPGKGRALTAILETEGSRMIDLSDGTRVARKRLMAILLWDAVENGEIKLPGGKVMMVAPDDWLAIIQFLYKHIDGPPKQELDVTSAGEKIVVTLKSDND